MTQQHRNGDISPDRFDSRDTFAAAALTGILANPHDDLLASDDSYATMAYELADAMLRERLRQFDRSQPIKPAEDTPATHATPGEGSVRRNCSVESRETVQQEPVAWAILHNDHQYVSLLREHAEAHNVYVDAEVVPLYRSPALTESERAAIYRAEARLRTAYVPDDQTAATLRKLLERLP
jgi:hypothetical protein